MDDLKPDGSLSLRRARLPWHYRLAALLPASWGRMFNLNDPRWGRSDGQDTGENRPVAGNDARGQNGQSEQQPEEDKRPQGPWQSGNGGGNRQPEQGPPDLDELWRDLNQKIGKLFGGKGSGASGGWSSSGGNQPPDMKGAGIGIGLIAAVAAVIWGLSGFFIVQEGQQAVITRFGQYKSTVGAGINWNLPYPIERHETVNVTQIRSVDIGSDSIVKNTGLTNSAMLTADENIVELKFAVQYRLSNARDYLFASRDPDQAVVQSAETAVREVIGNMRMDSALAEERDQVAPRVRKLMQDIIDRYKIGVDVVAVNMQQGGVRPPEQVKAAFDDVLKADQERARAVNEAQAYANRVIPLAAGTASRLRAEADGYKAKVVDQARGDADRFASILPEYQKAPQATRDRMYNDTMQQIYSNVTKVMVDTRQGSMLYLPLDKIMQSSNAGAAATAPANTRPADQAAASQTPATATGGTDARSRNPGSARDRNAP